MHCKRCEAEFECGDDYFECDECAGKLHIKCDGVIKRVVISRQASSRLEIFCRVCVESPENINTENIVTVLKFVHKIDFFHNKKVCTRLCLRHCLQN